MRFIGSASHQGDYDGKAATGKTVSYEGLSIFHMNGNRIAEGWSQSDWPRKFPYIDWEDRDIKCLAQISQPSLSSARIVGRSTSLAGNLD